MKKLLLLLTVVSSLALTGYFVVGDDDKLSPPQLNAPADNAHLVPEPRLSWYMVPLAPKYRVNYKSSTLDEYNKELTSTDYTIPNPKKGVRYTWKVKSLASDPKNDSDWSATRTFTTLIAAPVQLSPTNGEINVGTMEMNDTKVAVRLTWKASDGATSYIPEIEGMTSPNALGGTEFTFHSLDKGKTYKWRVKAIGPDEHSAWSPWWAFTTKK